jgi:hypothetical protein
VVLGTIFFFFFVLVFDYGDGAQCKDLYCESSFLTNLYFLSPFFYFLALHNLDFLHIYN